MAIVKPSSSFEGKLKLLIITAHQELLDLIQSAIVKLELLDFETAKVATLREAIEKIQSEKFNAILLDLALPDSRGLGTLRSLLRVSQEVAIVATDSEGTDDLGSEAIRLGAQDFIEKERFASVLLDRTLGHAIIRQLFVNKLHLFNKTKDEFLSIVSHDLRSPLSFIRSSIQQLLGNRSSLDLTEMSELLERANGLAGYALNLINDLLDLGKIEHGLVLHYEKFVVKDLISTCLNYASIGLAEKRITLTTEYENEHYEVYADPARISQAINNIISNAIKFSPQGGEIHVAVSAFQGRRMVDPKRRILKIAVTDNGPGIPKDKLARIFDKYEQARQSDSRIGTGLGLSICQQILRLHKGNIWVESEEGKGSTFSLFIPNLIEKRAPQDAAEEAISRKSCILIVDDYDDVRISTRFQLENIGFQVVEASNGREAVALIAAQPPDLVLTDLDLPVMDGMNLIHAIRNSERTKALPIVVFTAKANQAELDHFFRLVNDFIFKPARPEELEFKLKNALNLAPEVVSYRKWEVGRPTVIITDNETRERSALIEYVHSTLDCNVLAPKNGVEAQFLFKKHRVDFLLADLNLPMLTGVDLIRNLRGIREVPAALVIPSGYAYAPDFKNAASISHVLVEPLDPALLAEILSRHFPIRYPGGAHGNTPPRILVVDDSEDNRHLMKVLLKGQPYQIEEADNGAAALEKIRANGYQLILMDMIMPVLDGWAATRQVRSWESEASRPRVPIIAITAHENKNELEKCLSVGCDACLSRPILRQTLIDIIDKHLEPRPE